jgi:fatty acid synthase subunit alpha
LDSVVKSYAQFHGVNLSSPTVPHNSSVVPMNMSTQVAVSNVDTKRLAQLFKDQLEGLNEYFDIDSRTGDRSFEKEKERNTSLQTELDRLIQEFGTEMLEGCRPIFDALKQRKFNSWWNWNRQDILELYFKVCASGDVVLDHEAWKQRRHVLNTATRELVDINAYYVEKAKREGRNEIVISNAQNLLEAVRDNINKSPLYCLQSHSYKATSLTGPKVEINPKTGQLEYKEDQRAGIDLFIDYVASIKAQLQVIVEKEARHISSLMQVHKVALEGVRKAINNAHPRFRSQHRKNQKRFSPSDRSPCHRSPAGSDMGSGAVTPSALAVEENPVIFIENRDFPTAISVDVRKTNTFLRALEAICKDGVNFSGKTALVTGGGRGSIGVEIVKALLDGGAKVFVTTSSYSEEICTYYRKVYQQHGSKGSELTVVPWNAASRQDIDALVNFIYGTEKEDLDFLVPFAALSQVDKDISELDSKTELASRLMFNNVLRLVGKVKKEKERKQQEQRQTACTRPCHVILPLSPNHGQFGRDGFYAETKLALEGLMNKWKVRLPPHFSFSRYSHHDYLSKSESWGAESGQITLVGAIIGWTRGTGLMNDNNLIASGFEKLGARTFTTGEMAFNIVGLLHPSVVSLATTDPLWCNLTGGFEKIENLQKTTNDIRNHLRNRSGLVKDILNDEKKDQEFLKTTSSLPLVSSVPTTLEPRMNLRSNFPDLPSQERFDKLQQEVNLKGVIDLEKVVVVTGFGEVGPFGSSRNRWEVECYGEFSVEGCIELAWVTGLIKYSSGTLPSSTQFYSGWVDAKTGAPVSDIQVKPKYEKVLLERSGIRLIEPEINDGYDPEKKQFLRQVIVTRDLDPVELGDNEEEAQMFKRENGDRVDIWEEEEKKTWWLKMRKGAVLFVPKAMKVSTRNNIPSFLFFSLFFYFSFFFPISKNLSSSLPSTVRQTCFESNSFWLDSRSLRSS